MMVMLGLFFIASTSYGLYLLYRKRLSDTRWYLRLMLWSIPLPLVATQLGWIVTEVGRQPWVVYRLLKTADAYSKNVAAGEILFSIIVFGFIYLLLAALYIFILMKMVRKGPAPIVEREV
jgi:cytochrome d ubiquinol oxidase subunit I